MKCGKCGQNEANYYYRETVNGVTHEVRLCEDCAKEEGLQSRFERGFGFGDSFFRDFFAPFDSFFGLPSQRMAALKQQSAQKTVEQGEPKEQTQSCDCRCNAELKQRRERNMLEQQLKDAVAREDYETAITLRDKLRELPQ